MSRTLRIKILLAIDLAFFFLELIVGYSVGSLALVADSFHMLNDVCSLVVALYAIKLASRTNRSEEYSYGWQRAEILGALINGVFLLALCFSIFLEAIQRAFNPSEVQNPKLVVIVGSLGLASNILGLILFHEHGHSHGPRGHAHSHTPLEDHSSSHGHHHHAPEGLKASDTPTPDEQTPLLATFSAPASPSVKRQDSSANSFISYDSSADIVINQSPKNSHSVLGEICVHPAQTRNNIVRAAELRRDELHHQASTSRDPSSHQHSHDDHHADDHLHFHPQEQVGHSHSHMNMHAIFLHALGDALGNVGVIAAGLLIWFIPVTRQAGRIVGNRWVLFADPGISLIITAIIFTSAIPLVRSASLILLQGTPPNINLGRVRKTLQAVPGVLQVHELHIWSLSESKLVASVHVLIEKQDEFIGVSRQIRKRLHHFGIHSSTIQPEILLDEQISMLRAKTVRLSSNGPSPTDNLATQARGGVGQRVKSFLLSRQNSAQELPNEAVEAFDEDGCLIQCDDACDEEACCPPGTVLCPPSLVVSTVPAAPLATHNLSTHLRCT